MHWGNEEIIVLYRFLNIFKILQYLLKRNTRRMRKVSDTIKRSANVNYSLSLRVQLKENVWTLQVYKINIFIIPIFKYNFFQKIEFGMFVVVIALISNLSLFIIPVFVLTEADQMETLQWCQWATNISIAVLVISFSYGIH